MSRPSSLPQWATDASRTLEPSSGEKGTGWTVSTRPAARKMNWIQNLIYQWLSFLNPYTFIGPCNWFKQTPAVAKAVDLNDIEWIDWLDGWFAVGDADGVDGYILESADGVGWAERAGGAKNVQLNGIAHDGSSVAVAVGEADGGDAYILSSVDGITWNERVNAKNIALNDVAWSPSLGLFAAVGDNDGADSYLVTSPDGITWTERATPSVENMNAIAWSADLGMFCAVGETDGSDSTIYTSTNGTSWTEQSCPVSVGLNGIAFAASFFVAVGDSGAILTSGNGTSWTDETEAGGGTFFGVAYDTVGTWIVMGSSTGIWTSDDTETWTQRTFIFSEVMSGDVAHDGKEYFCAVGRQAGGNPGIYTSLRVPVA